MGSLRQYGYTASCMCYFLPISETRALSVLNGSLLNHSGHLQCCGPYLLFSLSGLAKKYRKFALHLMQTGLNNI